MSYSTFFYIRLPINPMQKRTLTIAGISGALCVALGAMGAHALKDKIPAENLITYQTAVTYHFYHTIALILVVLLSTKIDSKFLNYASALFMAGIVLFSFSLYFLALRPVLGFNNDELKWMGAITPFGGISFILAWLLLSFSAIRTNK